MSEYSKKGLLEKLSTMLQPILTEELKNSFLQISLYYIMTNFASESL